MDLVRAISELKRTRHAVILAHYYQDSQIQDVADFIGDSLQLAQEAKRTDAEVILFAGVHFMAETAKIVNPTRRVVLPDLEAGCSLAQSCPADQLAAYRQLHPEYTVVSYVNTTAAVKALSDICCTSSNAEKVVRSIPADQPILFVPDRNLGAYVQKQTGRPMKMWQGSCIVHETFSERRLLALKDAHPQAAVLAHPECEPQVLRHADFIGSTAALLKQVTARPENAFIIATEPGIIHQMKKLAPEKEFIPAPPEGHCACNECPYMRRNTLEKVWLALRDMAPEITLPEDIRTRALLPIERMLALG
jgi:quinolinate synthase